MTSTELLIFTADALLVVHSLFVVFVIFGLILIFVGYFRNWRWVRNIWFRTIHLLAIAIVAIQSWIGIICPLTIWEMSLRDKAGEAIYSGSFLRHWLHYLLYYDAPEWVFITAYTVFGALVLASWFVVRPTRIKL